jgi:hypothetical protein
MVLKKIIHIRPIINIFGKKVLAMTEYKLLKTTYPKNLTFYKLDERYRFVEENEKLITFEHPYPIILKINILDLVKEKIREIKIAYRNWKIKRETYSPKNCIKELFLFNFINLCISKAMVAFVNKTKIEIDVEPYKERIYFILTVIKNTFTEITEIENDETKIYINFGAISDERLDR